MAHELLPWFYNGTLSSAESSTFEAHLEGCESCRKELDLLEELRSTSRQELDRLLSVHPTPETLVDVLLGERSGPEVVDVYRHLAFCPTCAVEARLLRDKPGERTRQTTASAPGRRSFDPRASMRWVAAVIVAAAVSYAGYVGWTHRDPGPGAPWSGTPNLNVIESPTRTGTEAASISVPAGQPYVLLGLVAPDEPAAPDDLFEIRIVRSDGTGVVWSDAFDAARLPAHRDSGVIPLVVPAGDLPEAEYVIVFVRGTGSREELIQRTRFRVVSSE